MAPRLREYNFIVGPETSTVPTPTDPSDDGDTVNKGFADRSYTPRNQIYGVASNITAVKAIGLSSRFNEQIVYVASTNQWYEYSSASTASNDDDGVLQPADLPASGRWIKTQQSGSVSAGVIVEEFDAFVGTLTTAESITVRDAVAIDFDSGIYRIFKADADAANRNTSFAGFALQTVSSNAAVDVHAFGPLSGFVGLTVGATYYLSTTAGAITTTPGVGAISVGKALSSTVLFVNAIKEGLNFPSPVIFIRSHGSSAGDLTANGQATVEHFNFSSWSNETADTNARSRLHQGSALFNNTHVIVDGVNTSGSLATMMRIYNKTAWSAGTTRGTAKSGQGVFTLSSVQYYLKGSNTADRTGAAGFSESWNGSAWASLGLSFSAQFFLPGTFLQGTKIYLAGGTNSGGSPNNNVESYNGSAVATETSLPASIASAASGQSAGSRGVVVAVGTNSYEWNGSSWSSAIGYGVTASSNGGVSIGGACGFDTSANTYNNGGTSSDSVSISTTRVFSSSTWSASTSSNTARAGAMASVF